MPSISGYPLQVYIVGGALLLLVAAFVLSFAVPAISQYLKLRRLIGVLQQGKEATNSSLDVAFSNDKTIKHLWEEYNDTLHEQRELNSQTGQFEVVAKRSTVPAEAIFTTQTLVDTPLKTEFFKHLPGILTGLGIIGTFAGLIVGLQKFKVDSNADVVREGLNNLVGGVYEAFLVSAIAIGLAMAATFLEKFMLATLYKQVEQLCQLLDGRYQAGAGEEYLSRLVIASEASAKEAKQLKQSLVEDLKKILEEVTERQIASSNAASTQVAERIVAGMNEGLREPLSEIRSAVQQVSGDQGVAVHKLLADTMTAMTAQIRDLFGSQITGINQMQQQTIEAMTTTVGKLQQVVADITTTGQATTDSMAQKISAAIEAMEGRQSAMDSQVRHLLEEVQSNIERANGNTNQKLQEALTTIAETVSNAVSNLQNMVNEASNRDAARSQSLERSTTEAVTGISSEVKALIEQTSTASQQMGQAIAAMQRMTTDSVDKMYAGANRLYAASEKFAEAGSQTTSVLDRAQSLVQQLSNASGALTGSSTTLNAAINDYKATRDSLAQMIEALRSTVESAKTEASLTANVLQRIESSTRALAEAERKADEYLNGVTAVLGEAHQRFSTQVISTLDEVNGEFHDHLRSATNALAGAIEDLESVFDKIPG